jgi:hypothetical protein
LGFYAVIVDDDADFLELSPHFHPEDYGSMYLRNVGSIALNWIV